jgi:hypothetical protein
MAYTRLFDLLPELALAETSLVELAPYNAYNLPAGEYGLVEWILGEVFGSDTLHWGEEVTVKFDANGKVVK